MQHYRFRYCSATSLARPDNNERLRAAAVPTTNSCSDRDFAQLDVLMRLKPAASIECLESIIMWTNNETSAWLADKKKG
ncbi:hypothetical protein MAR_000008 [Mya arenaria]|uniref:Uncharacterized protein n=1 Tax=Mya arenaria TaxID=6604 RepID=A0ABY7F7K6_MYAAR|nr:hypothetical protein MAR_000008 [Mya arenaria]